MYLKKVVNLSLGRYTGARKRFAKFMKRVAEVPQNFKTSQKSAKVKAL